MDYYDLKAEFNENYRYAHDYWGPYITDAQNYTLAASGYTWTQEERIALEKEGREIIEYNIMRQPLQYYSGYLRDNLNNIVIAPVEGSDQKTADQLDKISTYIWEKGRGYNTFLDACDESLKSGICLCGIQLNYSKDFINGDISFYKRTFNSFYLDPTFESLDLSDCGYAIMRDLVGKAEVKELLPFVDPKEIDDIQTSFRDDKFMSYHPQFTTLSRRRNLLAYDQYYRRRTRQREYIIDQTNSYYRDITDLDKEEKDKLKFGVKRLKSLYSDHEELGIDSREVPIIEFKTVERPYIELNIMLNGQQVYCGEDKTGITEAYPFVPIVCYFEPSIWMPCQRLQGIAASIWSLQRQFNKRHMKITDIMDSVISTGFKYLIGSVPDPQEMQQSGQNKLIGIDPENAPEGLNSVQQLEGGTGANPAIMQYQQTLDELSLKLANVNESILGVDEGGNTQVSGRLAEVRIAQGLRTNRKVFDNIEYSQKLLGGLVLLASQKNMPVGKVERIIGETPTEQFYDSEFEQYDADIKQGIRSQSQKDAYYYELVNLKREGIVDVPQEEIVKALPMAGKSDLEEALAAQKQQMDEQQKKVDAQEVMALKLANAHKDEMIAMAQSRRADVVSKNALAAERASEAEENRAQAALARAKTITEIASMQDDRILKVLDFVNMLELQEAEDREKINTQIHAQADQINSETEGTAENTQLNSLMNMQMNQQNPQDTDQQSTQEAGIL